MQKQQDKVQKALDDIGEATDNTWDDIKDGTRNTFNDVRAEFRKLGDKISDAFDGKDS